MGDDIKERLIGAAVALLRECAGGCEITVRDIAARAGASPGLINYHFGSKDELLAAAAARIWGSFDGQWDEVAASPDGPTLMTRLKRVLKEVALATLLNRSAAKVMVRSELLESDFPTTRYLVRVLRKALPPSVSGREIAEASWLLVPPLQLVLLRSEAFGAFVGFDPDDRAEREAFFDRTVDAIIGPLAARAGAVSTRGPGARDIRAR